MLTSTGNSVYTGRSVTTGMARGAREPQHFGSGWPQEPGIQPEPRTEPALGSYTHVVNKCIVKSDSYFTAA